MDDNEAALKALGEAQALDRQLAELIARELADHRKLTLEAMQALARPESPASVPAGPAPAPG